ncbi:MAG: DUF539 domain-containing protein [Gammaproteobacteria bacterium]|jgi:hypothetical protein|nr:DUF539 domain-containing protein [Gammaproteobacteria bacterium]
MSVFATLFLSFIVVALAVTAMAIGVMAGRTPIKGSCGGLNGGSCELCSGTGECRKRAKNQR